MEVAFMSGAKGARNKGAEEGSARCGLGMSKGRFGDKSFGQSQGPRRRKGRLWRGRECKGSQRLTRGSQWRRERG